MEQCRKEWSKQGKEYSYPDIVKMAQSVTDIPALFNPDEPRFANPDSMLAQVTNGRLLSDAQIVACIFHSLANRYGEVFRMLQQLVNEPIGALYIIGGGARNQLLNSLTEKAVGVPVRLGSTEATAVGNVLVQKNHK